MEIVYVVVYVLISSYPQLAVIWKDASSKTHSREARKSREARLSIGRTPAYHAACPGSFPRARSRELLGVKTWLSTLEIVNLCVFRMRH